MRNLHCEQEGCILEPSTKPIEGMGVIHELEEDVIPYAKLAAHVTGNLLKKRQILKKISLKGHGRKKSTRIPKKSSGPKRTTKASSKSTLNKTRIIRKPTAKSSKKS